MKFKYKSYEVEISATDSTGNDMTAPVLNLISLIASEATDSYKKAHLDGLAANSRELAQATYETLDATGYYDDVR